MSNVQEEDIKRAEEESHRQYHRRLMYIAILILAILFGSATFYYYIEKWRFIDAVYFSAETMTTVGYGDITPHTDAGKIFTVIFMFTGVGIALYGLSTIASHVVESRQEYWYHHLSNPDLLKHTKTVTDILKNMFHFDKEKLLKGEEYKSRKKK